MSLTQRLIEDPEIAACIRDLAEQTGIPVARYAQWLASDPPHGISRADWLDALTEASKASPLPAEAIEVLARMVAPTRQANAA